MLELRQETLFEEFPDPLKVRETKLVTLMSFMKGMFLLRDRIEGIEAAIRYTPGSTVVQIIVDIQLYVGSANKSVVKKNVIRTIQVTMPL